MTQRRVTVKMGIMRLFEWRALDWMFRVGTVLAGSNTGAQSFLLRSMLSRCRPEWKSLGNFRKLAAQLPNRDVIFALTMTRHSRDLELMNRLDRLTSRSIPALDYTRAFFDRRFVDAHDIWSEFPEVAKCLDDLDVPNVEGLTRSVAVVLPGPAIGNYGNEIDQHDLVARTGIEAPTPDDGESIGSRFDISFPNSKRFQRLLQSTEPVPIPADRLVVNREFEQIRLPNWLNNSVECGLKVIPLPTTFSSFAPLRIVPWAHRQNILPTLYFADFYLGETSYQSAHYDLKSISHDWQRYVRSYLKHDVFYTHRVLQIWRQRKVIRTRGRLDELLDLDGRSFAQSIQHRWGKRNS